MSVPARVLACDPLPPDSDKPSPSLDTLFRSERQGLVRYLKQSSGSDDAEDLVQKLFLRLAGRSANAIALEFPRAYLFKAARNLRRDAVRSDARTRHAMTTLEADTTHGAVVDPESNLQARDELARVEAAVLKLKPLSRQIFLARRVDGYSYEEIAKRTGLSVKGVEKQMSRALKQLGHSLRSDD